LGSEQKQKIGEEGNRKDDEEKPLNEKGEGDREEMEADVPVEGQKRRRGRSSKPFASTDQVEAAAQADNEVSAIIPTVTVPVACPPVGPKVIHRPWIPPLYIATLLPLSTTMPIYTLPSCLYAVLMDDRVKWTTPPSPLLISQNTRARTGTTSRLPPAAATAAAVAAHPKMTVDDFLNSKDLKPRNLNQVSKPRHYYKGPLPPLILLLFS
jgi:hypothetical protein